MASWPSFLQKAEADLTVVIDRGGNVISQFGDMTVMDVTIIAALAAGSFAATKELARRIGEIEFNALYHQGNGNHIFMNSVDDDTIMITVFGQTHDGRSGALLFVGRSAKSRRPFEIVAGQRRTNLLLPRAISPTPRFSPTNSRGRDKLLLVGEETVSPSKSIR